MKLGKVAKLCKDQQNITIVNVPFENGEQLQWVGTPYALYPMYGLPPMNERTAFMIFDVDEKKKPDYSYREFAAEDFPVSLELGDMTERQIEPERHSLAYESRIYIPIDTSKGLRLINRAYIAPMMSKLDLLTFFERKTPDGVLYIVAKLGLLIEGVIMPKAPRADDDDTLLDFARMLYERTEYALQCAKRDAERRAEKPVVVLVDRQTGEVVDDGDDGGDAA